MGKVLLPHIACEIIYDNASGEKCIVKVFNYFSSIFTGLFPIAWFCNGWYSGFIMKTLSIVVVDQDQMPLAEKVAEMLDKKGFDVELQDVPECDVASLPDGVAFVVMVEDVENLEDDV